MYKLVGQVCYSQKMHVLNLKTYSLRSQGIRDTGDQPFFLPSLKTPNPLLCLLTLKLKCVSLSKKHLKTLLRDIFFQIKLEIM